MHFSIVQLAERSFSTFCHSTCFVLCPSLSKFLLLLPKYVFAGAPFTMEDCRMVGVSPAGWWRDIKDLMTCKGREQAGPRAQGWRGLS